MNLHQDTLIAMSDFELRDFTDNPNFDQFINLLRGDENEDYSICNLDSDIINGCFVDNQFPPFSSNPFEFNGAYDPSSTLSSFSCFDEEVKGGEEENDSSATTVATNETTARGNNGNAKQRPKTDRSKTLISERRRRGRMKEKLYALRSLVPNITKMDKASIVGDAVSYVQGLQVQARKLKAEVAGLEASLLASENYQGSVESSMKVQNNHNINYPICRKITQMDMFQVEERGFYVKLVCNKGEGVASSLYKTLESLAGFNVQNSNLATVSDRFVLTFTLNVKGYEAEINLQNLKLWVTGALLNQGFEFITTFHASHVGPVQIKRNITTDN